MEYLQRVLVPLSAMWPFAVVKIKYYSEVHWWPHTKGLHLWNNFTRFRYS